MIDWLGTAGPRVSTMLLSCVMCVAVPGEATMVAAMTSSLASTWAALPDETDNSGMYELLMHINLLCGLAWSLLTGRPACEGLAASAPAARGLLVILLGCAALARANRDYHDVRRSASTVLTLRFLDGFCSLFAVPAAVVDKVGDRLLLRLLWCVLLAVEAACWAAPLLLLCGLVGPGLMVAWLLAAAIASTPSFDLSCVVVAGMPLWVQPHQLLALRWLTLAPAARCCTCAVALMLLIPALLQRSSTVERRLQAVAVIWIFAANPFQYSVGPFEPVPDCMSSVVVGASVSMFMHIVAQGSLLCAALNGASPYLGLKTQATWSMFSNLSVECGSTNHLFIPASAMLFRYTSECVTVTKTNVPSLQGHHTVMGRVASLQPFRGFAERTDSVVSVHANTTLCSSLESRRDWELLLPYSVPFLQLRRLIAVGTMPFLEEFFVEYLHCSAPHRFEVREGRLVRGSDPRIARMPPVVLRKFLAFRSAPVCEDTGHCTL